MSIEYTTAAIMQEEIDRLRLERNQLDARVSGLRVAVIEECARVADSVGSHPIATWIAEAIRAMKEGP